jgi:hypothetical protein
VFCSGGDRIGSVGLCRDELSGVQGCDGRRWHGGRCLKRGPSERSGTEVRVRFMEIVAVEGESRCDDWRKMEVGDKIRRQLLRASTQPAR